MSRTDQQRYDEALAYVKSVDPGLARDIDAQLRARAVAVGAEISLGGAGFWRQGTPAQHTAVRALLLCQIAFFRPPHCRANLADMAVLTATRSAYLGKTEAQVATEIRNYIRPPARSLEAVAQAALTANQPIGNLDFVTFSRTDRFLGANPICYNGVTAWLFISGMVSKQWLAGPGNKIDANSADAAFGQGQETPPAQWSSLPRGHLWTIQRQNDPTTCHWGVSLGSGLAAATNNTLGSLVLMLTRDDETVQKKSAYDTFEFERICQVLNSDFKYGHVGKNPPAKPDTNIKVKQINPMTSQALY